MREYTPESSISRSIRLSIRRRGRVSRRFVFNAGEATQSRAADEEEGEEENARYRKPREGMSSRRDGRGPRTFKERIFVEGNRPSRLTGEETVSLERRKVERIGPPRRRGLDSGLPVQRHICARVDGKGPFIEFRKRPRRQTAPAYQAHGKRKQADTPTHERQLLNDRSIGSESIGSRLISWKSYRRHFGLWQWRNKRR